MKVRLGSSARRFVIVCVLSFTTNAQKYQRASALLDYRVVHLLGIDFHDQITRHRFTVRCVHATRAGRAIGFPPEARTGDRVDRGCLCYRLDCLSYVLGAILVGYRTLFANGLGGWVRCQSSSFLAARSIFEDGFRLRVWHAGVFVVVEMIGLWYVAALHGDVLGSPSGRQLGTIAGVALQLLAVAFVLSALIIAHRGRAPDLVENRRRFRTLFVSVAGVYMLFVVLVEIFLRGEAPHPVASLLNAGAIFAIVITVSASLLTLRFKAINAQPLEKVKLAIQAHHRPIPA